jgi:hypothetical protein
MSRVGHSVEELTDECLVNEARGELREMTDYRSL